MDIPKRIVRAMLLIPATYIPGKVGRFARRKVRFLFARDWVDALLFSPTMGYVVSKYLEDMWQEHEERKAKEADQWREQERFLYAFSSMAGWEGATHPKHLKNPGWE